MNSSLKKYNNQKNLVNENTKQSTQSVHGGVTRKKYANAITTPIVQTATYTFNDTADLIRYMEKHINGIEQERLEYGRYGNPTIAAVEKKLALLDGGDDAVLYASGMSATTSLLLTVLPTASHIIMTDDCYRRTRQFCMTFLKRFGIDTSVVPVGNYEAMEEAIIPRKTRFIISESPTNPYLRIADLEKLSSLSKQYGIRTMIDSTFATPINQRPLEWGIDFVVHSATKYLSGHNDLLAGVVVGHGDRMKALREARGILGNMIDPHSAFLLERGLKTLALRVERQNEIAQVVAEFLEAHPSINRVYYPGLLSHPDHNIASAQMTGFGGVVSFEVKGDLESTGRFIDALQIPYIAPSLGGVESLVEQPAIVSYFDMTPEERLEEGIRDNLVRFAFGIEDVQDVLSDIAQALAVL